MPHLSFPSLICGNEATIFELVQNHDLELLVKKSIGQQMKGLPFSAVHVVLHPHGERCNTTLCFP
jgi:hypothetical protein